jgi:putative Ca2+/H+ antiporter (TMEM165/GDT1 family)
LDALLSSTAVVTLAEIGDKTQLLTLLLITRFRARTAITFGILIATVINHGISAWLGDWLVGWIPAGWGPWLIGLSFIAVGLWILIPDKDDTDTSSVERWGPFLATLVLFFLAEIGDKTQIATVILAAQYQSIFWVTLGTTAGMLAANLPVIFAGNWVMERVPVRAAHLFACALFIGFGVWTLIAV